MNKGDAMADAIRVMTAWASQPDRPDFASSQIEDILRERDIEGVFDLVAGFVSLSGVLLTRLEKATGAGYLETLQQIATKYTNREDHQG